MRLIKDILKMIFFPTRCTVCEKFCMRYLCEKCEKNLNQNFNTTIVNTLHKNVVCVSPFIYEGTVRKIIHNYKFKNQKNLYKVVSPFLSMSVLEKFKNEKFDLISSVPSLVRNSYEREYDHSSILGIELSKNLNIPYEYCIKKIKKNKAQHGLSFYERQENVKGVYKSIKNYENKNILLCDDIITTGATLSECVNQLTNSGARVLCATVSYTLNPKNKDIK